MLAARDGPRCPVDAQATCPANRRKTHPARDNRGVRGRTSSDREDPCRCHHPREVTGGCLGCDEDHRLAGLRHFDGFLAREHDAPDSCPRGRGQASDEEHLLTGEPRLRVEEF